MDDVQESVPDADEMIKVNSYDRTVSKDFNLKESSLNLENRR